MRSSNKHSVCKSSKLSHRNYFSETEKTFPIWIKSRNTSKFHFMSKPKKPKWNILKVIFKHCAICKFPRYAHCNWRRSCISLNANVWKDGRWTNTMKNFSLKAAGLLKSANKSLNVLYGFALWQLEWIWQHFVSAHTFFKDFYGLVKNETKK